MSYQMVSNYAYSCIFIITYGSMFYFNLVKLSAHQKGIHPNMKINVNLVYFK